ncbi:MAG TPA: DUF3750 domain-containing protein [Steroidobacteraceae bacterium]|nr:DUF3750 domain-containing protein [Steroidobacteraceae bacterium]
MNIKRQNVLLAGFLGYLLIAVLYIGWSNSVSADDWRTANRGPAGLAPDPATTPEAVVQVYGARTVGWRGYVGVHTWIAVKPSNAERFTVHEVIGYRLRRTGTVVVTSDRYADGHWFGAKPELLSDLRGEGVDDVIRRIDEAVTKYPYADQYRVWPGPNSNTFTAWVLRHAPEVRADLPPTAIGKDYLGALPLNKSPSGTGVQLNVLGVAGVMAGMEEGLELNVLGLTFGVDPKSLSLKLPLIGRVGLRSPRFPSRLQPAADAPPKTL